MLLPAANAKFRDTHAKFGLQPCWGLAGKLAGLIGAQRARYVSLTASPVDARTAERWGIVSHACGPKEDVKAAALKLALDPIRAALGRVRSSQRLALAVRYVTNAQQASKDTDLDWTVCHDDGLHY